MEDLRGELAGLISEVGAQLEWDASLGGVGLLTVPVAPAAPTTTVEPPEKVVVLASDREDSPPAASVNGLSVLQSLAEEAAICTRCPLSSGRTKSVFSRGNPAARLVFVGEGPGYHEDQQGVPFVGAAGQLLDKMVGAMGFGRDEVYVCNVVKCRPPKNRTPLPDEAAACKAFLVQQLKCVAPTCIVALGRCAAEHLGCLDAGDRGWRGRWSHYEGIPTLATYHPAFLLRNPEMKRPVWQDLQAVMKRLGEQAP